MAHPVDPLAAWQGIGSGAELTLEAVELHRVELAFRQPVRTARGVHRRRPVLLVRLACRGPDGPVEGWGECSALADATYDVEDVALAGATLEEVALPGLVAAAHDGGGLPSPSSVPGLPGFPIDRPLSVAAVEMAVADAHLRASGRSLATVVGAGPGPVAAGTVVGRAGGTAGLLEAVDARVAEGFTRVKLKIAPADDLGPVGAVRHRYPDLLLQVDANEGYTDRGADHDRLAELDAFGLLCIEQPFPRGDLGAHARLAARIATPVCLDESLTSPATVVEALDRGACSVVCVKPSRLGGIGAALTVLSECRRRGVPVWMGGMFESGYARQVNATLAALPGFAWPGDLGPPSEYLVEDLLPDHRARPAEAPVPQVDGVGPPPDPRTVARSTSRSMRLGGG
jgi:O-succinylbenzoate synthase